MSSNRRSVMLIALGGPGPSVADATNSALDAGLDPVVMVPATQVAATRQLLADRLLTERLPRIQPLRIHTFGRIRNFVMGGVTRVTSAVGKTMRRLVRAMRVRTGFGRRRQASLARLEPRVEAFPTKIASSILRVGFDIPLAVVGRAITEGRNIFSVRRLALRLQREGMLIGVVCIDGRGLIPGWYTSRMSPSIPVLTAYPDDWNSGLVAQIDRFENGPRWT